MAVTIQKIADLAGVSRGTVDRALNGRGRVNADVAARILSIANELDYIPKSKRKKNTWRRKTENRHYNPAGTVSLHD